jgi:hypothetical protein
MVHHIFGEVALPAVGARQRGAALGVAVVAAGDKFGRTYRAAIGAATGVVVLVEAFGQGSVAARDTGGQRERRLSFS